MAATTSGANTVARQHLSLLTPFTIRLARVERLVRLGQASMERLKDRAGGSRATVKRDLSLLREMGADVVYDPFDNSYRLQNADWPGVQQFVAEELRRWA